MPRKQSDAEKEVLGLTERRIIEFLGKAKRPCGRFDIDRAVNFVSAVGKTRHDLLDKLEKKGLLEVGIGNRKAWEEDYRLSPKGQQIFLLLDHVNQAWREIREILGD